MSKYARYRQLFAMFLLITMIIWLVSTFYFAFYDAIPKVQRSNALFRSITTCPFVIVFFFGFAIYEYLFKNVHDFIIWIAVAVSMSIGIVPAIYGFGWIYAILVGIPWGVAAFYYGKMEQERWKAHLNNKDMGKNRGR